MANSSQLSPRQRMINMMYLVLTALLALNISNEVLKAFVKVDKSLDKTTKNFTNKSQQTYALFNQAALDNPVKAGPWKEKAFEIKYSADEAYNFIQNVKDTLEILANIQRDEDGWDERMSQREVHANLLINQGVGFEIKQQLGFVKEKLLSFVDSSNIQLRKQITDALNTEDKSSTAKQVSWESEHFENIALAPVFTYLTQFQSEVRNSEAAVIDYLFQNIDAGAVKFNKLNATVIAPTNYILLGDSFKADVFVTAFDTTQDPEVLVYTNYDSEGSPIGEPQPINVDGGVGKYNVSTGKEGYFTWGGIIRVKTDGGIKEYPFMNSYQVSKPALVVSPTKMNILYRGVDNPIDISVPGVPPENLSVSCSGCKISGRNGKYVATVSSGSKATINVSAKDQNGKIKRIGNSDFRVGRIPPPEASIAGKTDGKISRSALKNAQGIGSFLRDFPFDIKYSVTEFTVRAMDGQYVQTVKVKGNRFNTEVRSLVGRVKTGSDVSFTGIKAKGPDGAKKCNPITLTVQ